MSGQVKREQLRRSTSGQPDSELEVAIPPPEPGEVLMRIEAAPSIHPIASVHVPQEGNRS